MATGSYLSVITLNVNGLNAPTKRQRLDEWIQRGERPGLTVGTTPSWHRELSSASAGESSYLAVGWGQRVRNLFLYSLCDFYLAQNHPWSISSWATPGNLNWIMGTYPSTGASLVAYLVKNPPAMQETLVWFLSREDALEEGMATHSRILAWRIPWTEETGWIQEIQIKTLYFYLCMHPKSLQSCLTLWPYGL